MSQSSEPERPSDHDVVVDNLSSGEQEKLRAQLNRNAWRRRFEQAYEPVERNSALRANLGLKCASALQILVERLESGDIDEDIKQTSSEMWQALLIVMSSLPNDLGGNASAPGSAGDDPEAALEQEYDAIQGNVIRLRLALAQAIATEKVLQNELQAQKDQAATWKSRADSACSQKDEELAHEANSRLKAMRQLKER